MEEGEDIVHQLGSFHLSEREANIIPIENNDVQLSAEECRKSLVGKLIGGKKAHLKGLKRTIKIIWHIKESVAVREPSPNFFQFIFSELEDKEKVSKGVGWTFENQALILRDWEEDITEDHPDFRELKILVHIWNIPINWTTEEVGVKIGKVFNRTADVLIPQGGLLAGKCIRILAAVDITQPLMRCASIQLGAKKIIVDFKYEWLPATCYYYGILGHLDRAYDQRASDIAEGKLRRGMFGEWIRAQDFQSAASFLNSHNNNNLEPSTNKETPNPKPSSQTSNHPLTPLHQITPPNPDIPSNSQKILLQPEATKEPLPNNNITPAAHTAINPQPLTVDSTPLQIETEETPLQTPLLDSPNSQNLITTCSDKHLANIPVPIQTEPSTKIGWKRREPNSNQSIPDN
ncbi:Unknown protein [Striga hermonthica]|uniref:DUF4283 domain-containing protein n=1 Tax=Striga hermonthica TaxID=68872 RepID=A0A9N7RCN5_STRHE|nr:Unknown protein [Striga hermonthica]